MTQKSQFQSKTIRNAFVLDSNDLSHRVVNGASFVFLGIVLRTLLTLGTMSVLARLLSPSDFGHLAMSVVVTELAGLFGAFGLTNVLIQRRVISRIQLDTVFWASAAVGIVLTLMVFLFSYVAEWFYGDPITGELLRVMCFMFTITSLTSVHEAIIARLMRFRTAFFIQILYLCVRGGSAIIFAYLGYGVWSLVVSPLIGLTITFLCYALVVPYFPRFRFHLYYLTSNWKTSTSYLSNGIIFYINSNFDLVLIGRHLGAEALGYYQNASSLTNEIRARIAVPLQRVLFPAFSSLQGNIARLQHSVFRSSRLIAAIVFPAAIGLSAIAEELVPVLYGNKWLAMIPVIKFFGLSAALRGSTAISTAIFNSQNRVSLALKYHIAGTILMIAAIVITLPYGIIAVSFGISCASFYSLIIFRAGLRLIGLTTSSLVQIVSFPALSAVVMYLAICFFRPISTMYISNSLVLLMTHIAMGAITYSFTLHLLSRQYLQDFLDIGKKLFFKKH